MAEHAEPRGWAGLVHRLGRVRGPRTVVLTDTASALPAEVVQEYADVLRVVPMPVTVGERVLVEGEDDVPTQLALGLALGERVSTSGAPAGRLLSVLDAAAGEGFDAAVVITLAGALSGTADAARWAAERAALPTLVVDSHSVGLGEGFAVLAALRAARERAPWEQVRDAAGRGGSARVWFTVPSLEQLRRGGRIGAAASVLGTLLNVKPILTLDRQGAIHAAERQRSTARAVGRMAQLAAEAAGEDPSAVRIGVHQFGAKPQAERLVEELAPLSSHEVVLTSVPAVLAAHTGAGALGVVVYREAPEEHAEDPQQEV